MKFSLISHDYLQIFDGDKLLDKLTGEIPKSEIVSSHSHMKLHFHSDHIGTRKGFRIKISFILAGKYILGLSIVELSKEKPCSNNYYGTSLPKRVDTVAIFRLYLSKKQFPLCK